MKISTTRTRPQDYIALSTIINRLRLHAQTWVHDLSQHCH